MKVSYYPAARHDIVSQIAYFLDEFSYDAAERFPAAIDGATAFLVSHPNAGVPSMAGLRAWAIPEFPRIRIFYKCPTANDLHVIRILHTARDIDSILGER